jgi:hypothetical protein
MSNKSPTVFALSTMTHLIPKYHKDENGDYIDPSFNNRMYAKKAYKAYLKGKSSFIYKDNIYMVPKISKQALEDYLESVSLEELESFNPLENTEENEQ